MISFLFNRRENKICGFTVCGHAMFAESGQDIVCASVSSAVMLTANLLTENFNVQSDVKADENRITVSVTDNREEYLDAADKLLCGLAQHVEMVSEEFEGCIKTEYSEV